MRVLDVALKDLKQLLRTPMSVVFMFAAPLLITGLLFLAFGGFGGEDEPALSPIAVTVANLDEPPEGAGDLAVGDMLVSFLRDADLDVLDVAVAADANGARAAVDEREAEVGIIIPSDLTESVRALGQEVTIRLYQDPVLTIGPAIVEEVLNEFLDSFSGAKIATEVVADQWRARDVQIDPIILQHVAQAYSDWLDRTGHHLDDDSASIIDWRSPGTDDGEQGAAMVIGSIMASMTIFFAFFMGANTAESIIREDESGTLPRLFTTPTSRATILAGKYLFVFLTLVIQLAVLLLVGRFFFGIDWGSPGTVVLAALGLVVAAAGFGVLLMSFIENTRQTGPVMGGVLTITGMVGGLFTSGVPNVPAIFDTVSLVTPQGWALRAWTMALNGGAPGDVLVSVAILAGMGLLFLTVGILIFRRRFS